MAGSICGYIATYASFETWYPHQKQKRGEEPMETLYEVIVVSRTRGILFEEKVVARDEDEASLKLNIHSVLTKNNVNPRHVTILHRRLGDVRVRKDVQRVMVVDNDDD